MMMILPTLDLDDDLLLTFPVSLLNVTLEVILTACLIWTSFAGKQLTRGREIVCVDRIPVAPKIFRRCEVLRTATRATSISCCSMRLCMSPRKNELDDEWVWEKRTEAEPKMRILDYRPCIYGESA